MSRADANDQESWTRREARCLCVRADLDEHEGLGRASWVREGTGDHEGGAGGGGAEEPEDAGCEQEGAAEAHHPVGCEHLPERVQERDLHDADVCQFGSESRMVELWM
eukprot:2315019-Rhodomonas_salina.2